MQDLGRGELHRQKCVGIPRVVSSASLRAACAALSISLFNGVFSAGAKEAAIQCFSTRLLDSPKQARSKLPSAGCEAANADLTHGVLSRKRFDVRSKVEWPAFPAAARRRLNAARVPPFRLCAGVANHDSKPSLPDHHVRFLAQHISADHATRLARLRDLPRVLAHATDALIVLLQLEGFLE